MQLGLTSGLPTPSTLRPAGRGSERLAEPCCDWWRHIIKLSLGALAAACWENDTASSPHSVDVAFTDFLTLILLFFSLFLSERIIYNKIHSLMTKKSKIGPGHDTETHKVGQQHVR